MATYRLMDGVSGRPGVGSSGTQPPSTATSFSGNYIAGLVFGTSSLAWMTGYWWWVPPGGDTGPVKCALWQQGGGFAGNYGAGTLVAGSVVTSGTLTAGAWNFIALPSPLPLSYAATTYVAALGYNTVKGFPSTTHQFGSGNPYASGIVNGPLSAPATLTSGAAATGPQQPFSTASADPSAVMPGTNDLDDLLWLDVQVTDVAPANATYRLWPNRPYSIGDGTNGGVSALTGGYNIGPQVSVTVPCKLLRIWFYSATSQFSGSAAAALPTRCGIWDVNTQLEVAGTDNSSVSWKKPDGTAGSAGQGWLYCDYSSSGVTLQASHPYKVNAWYAGGSTWRTAQSPYWSAGNPGANGITMGPLAAPNTTSASVGQESWNGPNLAWAYPSSYSNPENDWIDVEVAPVSGSGLLMASGII